MSDILFQSYKRNNIFFLRCTNSLLFNKILSPLMRNHFKIVDTKISFVFDIVKELNDTKHMSILIIVISEMHNNIMLHNFQIFSGILE